MLANAMLNVRISIRFLAMVASKLASAARFTDTPATRGACFRLAYNEGAALNLTFGSFQRQILSFGAIAAIIGLLYLYRKTSQDAVLRAAALALLTGGALGNLLDRLRSARGVVDFIDLGVGDARFWTFNLADVGVTLGALLLAVVLWREDQARA